MPTPTRPPSRASVHHATLAGNTRQRIFDEPDDYKQFLSYLSQASTASGARILAYCCLPDSAYLIVDEVDEPVMPMIERVGARYSSHVNRERPSSEGSFQVAASVRPVGADILVPPLLTRLHFRPVEAGLCDRPEDYRWSDRRSLGHPTSIVDFARLEEIIPFARLLDHEARYELTPSYPHVSTLAPTGAHRVLHGV